MTFLGFMTCFGGGDSSIYYIPGKRNSEFYDLLSGEKGVEDRKTGGQRDIASEVLSISFDPN